MTQNSSIINNIMEAVKGFELAQTVERFFGVILSAKVFTTNSKGEPFKAPQVDLFIGQVVGWDEENNRVVLGSERRNLRVFLDNAALSSGEIDLTHMVKWDLIDAEYTPGSNGTSGRLLTAITYDHTKAEEVTAFLSDLMEAGAIEEEGTQTEE